ncbi:MAG: ABC-F family ATP-binding cassette domain-containing protein, partial [Spirochaetales bacterium]|nr:ABC-F family ATP-binding cassette domain-containing protein [Spirochaetales bacterium]
DIETILWLEEWLKSFKGAVMMTSHDRDFMTRICKRTIEVAAENIVTYSGDYDFYLKESGIRRDQLLAASRRQQAMLAKEEEFIARFAARASHAAQVQSRVKMLEKVEKIIIPPSPKVIKLKLNPLIRSGDIVVKMDNLSKTWPLPDGSFHPVFSGISGVVERTNKIALTGINGAGKSTLLKVIADQTDATSGSSILGASVKAAYFSQYSCDLLNPENSIYEEVSERLPNESIGYIKNLLGSFQFSGDDVDKKISILSGGEKSRVMLACLLAGPVNFLILDEPTNHLDIASREVLLEALQDFEGTIIIVSHDRYFLRNIVNRVFEIDHGAMRVYEGDYNYYLEKKGL